MQTILSAAIAESTTFADLLTDLSKQTAFFMYADEITTAMERAIGETNRRRAVQEKYNQEHGITPRSVEKKVGDLIEIALPSDDAPDRTKRSGDGGKKMSKRDREAMIEKLTGEMKDAARRLDFELAAFLRDKIRALREDGAK